MKNQNPQDILNEILLRMNYDSLKTLSENKKLIYEQATYYYDANGYLKQQEGPFNLPKGAVLASKAYPNLKPGEYPNYWYTKFLYDQPKTQTQEPKKVDMISPYNYVPTNSTPEGREAEMRWYSSLYQHNQNPKVFANPGKKPTDADVKKPKTLAQLLDEKPSGDNIKEFQDFLDKNYGSWLTTPNYIGKLNQDISKGYGIFGPNTNKMWDKPEVRSAWKIYKMNKQSRVPIPQSDILGPQGSFSRSVGYNKPEDQIKAELKLNAKFQEEKRQQELIAKIDAMYQKELNDLNKKYEWLFGENELKFLSPHYNKTLDEYKKELEALDKKYYKTKFSLEEIGDVFLPEKTNFVTFKLEDFKSANSIKNSFFTDFDDQTLGLFTTNEPSGTYFYETGKPPTKGIHHDWIWRTCKEKVKSFVMPEPFNNYTWKRKLYLTKDDYFEVSENFYTKDSSGTYIEYFPESFGEYSFWYSSGPVIFNLASMIVSLMTKLNPYTFAIGAALDLTAAYLQYKKGEKLGSAISMILAVTPLISLSVKIDKTLASKLSSKFLNAQTELDVVNITKNLTKEELNALDIFRRTDDLKEISAFANNPNNVKALESTIKSSPLRQTGKNFLRVNAQLGVDLSLLVGSWDTIGTENLDKIQMLDLLFAKAADAAQQIATEEQKVKLATSMSEKLIKEKTASAEDVIAEIEEKKRIIKELMVKSTDEKLKKFLSQSITFTDNQVESLKQNTSTKSTESDKTSLNKIIKENPLSGDTKQKTTNSVPVDPGG